MKIQRNRFRKNLLAAHSSIPEKQRIINLRFATMIGNIFLRQDLAGDINLPSTIGSWTGGSGNNPGDLGEDIRSMPLQSNMTRTTIEHGHPNVGNCYY